MSTTAAITFIALLVVLRLYMILPRKHHSRNPQSSAHVCTIAVFLGSGGHTSEALALVSALDFRRYNRRIYIVSEGDDLSEQKAMALEMSKGPPQKESYCILTIPRARRVHQSLLTTPLSAFFSLIACIYHLSFLPLAKNHRWADILILNGPGTCFVLCITVYLNKFFGLQTPLVIYVESFARVKSLSLSGKLIQPLADRFILQWEEPRDAQRRNRNTWLV